MYEYTATVTRVVDGDTLYATVDLGFGVSTFQCLRLHRVNAPELKTEEGKKVKEVLTQMLTGKEVSIVTIKDRKEKFGRYLAEIFLIDGTNINDWLLQSGFAEAYGTL